MEAAVDKYPKLAGARRLLTSSACKRCRISRSFSAKSQLCHYFKWM